MRQRTTLTSMTQFALQVVPREDEDERQKEQPHELLKPCLALVLCPARLLTPLTRRCVCRNTPASMRCDEKLHNCLAVIFEVCRSNEQVRVDKTRRHKRMRSPRRRGTLAEAAGTPSQA